MKINKTLAGITAVLLCNSSSVWADHSQHIEVIEVTGQSEANTQATRILSTSPVTKPVTDSGELMRSVNGMTAVRRGGRGFDPVIRGQGQTKLNVMVNGGYLYGAGPGRMDPPSSYIAIDSFDTISVIKGYRSVVYGAGGSGGTVVFEHQRPDFSDGAVTGSVSLGYTGNSELKSHAGDIAVGSERGFIRLFGAKRDADNYEDGNGDNVASEFNSEGFGIIGGIDVTDSDYVEITHEQAHQDDALFPGNGMDAIYADARTTSAKWHHHSPIGFIDELELLAYRADAEHLMDNYSIRNRNPMMPMGMAALTAADTWGGRLTAKILSDYGQWKLGVEHRAIDKKANLFMDMGKNGSFDMLVSRIWPKVEQRQTGVFAELDYEHDDENSFRFGLRVDHFESDAKTARTPTGMMGVATPTTLYQANYGSNDTSQSHTGVNLVLGWEHLLNDNTIINTNLSRSVRTPDATENWVARRAMGGVWVGNPELDEEVHYQLDLSLQQQWDSVDWKINAFVDEIDDYIDLFKRGNAMLYRNIDARIYGLETEGNWRITDHFSARIGIAYARGHGDKGDLPKISPLEARVNLDYHQQQWAVGAEWIASAQQSDFNEVQDASGTTSGFGVMHLYGHWKITPQVRLEAGVENLFDNSYTYHVNATNVDPFNPTATRVNEPGRQTWIKASYHF